MCDLVSATMALGAVFSVGATMYQADATAKAAQYNAKVQNQNAIMSEANAQDALRRGRAEEERLRKEGSLLVGTQEAAFTAGNIDLGYGSPLDALIATTTNIELDAMTIRENSAREAKDYRMQAYNQRSGAAMSLAEGKNAKTAGLFTGVGQVLTGGAQIGKYRASLKAPT